MKCLEQPVNHVALTLHHHRHILFIPSIFCHSHLTTCAVVVVIIVVVWANLLSHMHFSSLSLLLLFPCSHTPTPKGCLLSRVPYHVLFCFCFLLFVCPANSPYFYLKNKISRRGVSMCVLLCPLREHGGVDRYEGEKKERIGLDRIGIKCLGSDKGLVVDHVVE